MVALRRAVHNGPAMALVSYGRRVTELAAAQPDAVAFVCEGQELTRGALERDANRLAREFARAASARATS